MTWFIEDRRSRTQKILGNILQNGPIPAHVAIIMDGNRRFARQNQIKQIQGHVSGFEKLAEALNWCFEMQIKEVTVYAFSIENFKRSKDEIDDLFNLAQEKFAKLLTEQEKMNQLGVCIRVFGDLSMVREDLAQTMRQVIEITSKNTKCFLNICFAYTSREEMTLACRQICQKIQTGHLNIKDITDNTIDSHLYTAESLQVDLLVRTSGEVRLSDFLLWQCSKATVNFVKQLWPDFSIWNFYMGILNYQLNYSYLKHC